MRKAKRDRKMMTCKSEMSEQTVKTGLPVHNCWYRTARTRLPGRGSSAVLLRQEFQDITSGTEQPEKIVAVI